MMNKNLRLLVSVLFAAIILLVIALTRFYVDNSRNMGKSTDSEEIVRKVSFDDDGNHIFEGSNGLYGISDSSDRVIAAAEWKQLHFASEGLCIAAANIGYTQLNGCIDYDGNIVVPFIYSRISRREISGFEFYEAVSASDESIVLYDSSFVPLSGNSWESLDVNGSVITLKSGKDVIKYTVGKGGFSCIDAQLCGESLGSEFMLGTDSRILLSKLSYSMLRNITDGIAVYIEYAFGGDPEALSAMAAAENMGNFVRIFPNDRSIASCVPLSIGNVYIYTERDHNGIQSYAASVSVDTAIEYYDENGLRRRLNENCKATVRFADGNSVIEAVSGAFAKESPSYPQPETQPVTEGTGETE